MFKPIEKLRKKTKKLKSMLLVKKSVNSIR